MGIRKDLLDNLEAAFQAIIDVGTPQADGGNSGLPIGLSVEPQGHFAHTALTLYRVEVTTAGLSGAAKCTITDLTDGGDTVVGEQTITSGQDINLGVRGGKIRFTWNTGDSLQLGDKWQVTCDIYNKTVKQVLRAKAVGVTLKQFPAIVIGRAENFYEQVDGPKYKDRMRVLVEYWDQERSNIDDDLEEGLEDIENACQLDPLRGGEGLDTILLRAEPGIPEPGQPYGVMSVEIDVLFNHVVNP